MIWYTVFLCNFTFVFVEKPQISDSLDVHSHEVINNFLSLQYALFITIFVCVLGAGFFLFTSVFVVRDKAKADKFIKGKFLCLFMSRSDFVFNLRDLCCFRIIESCRVVRNCVKKGWRSSRCGWRHNQSSKRCIAFAQFQCNFQQYRVSLLIAAVFSAGSRRFWLLQCKSCPQALS